MRRLAIYAGLALLASGCANVPPEVRAAQQKKLDETTPVCRSDKECEAKWAAARSWILNHAGMKLRIITPEYMETYGSISSEIAVAVQKVPTGNGTYVLAVKTWCNQMNMMGCVPDQFEAAQSFNDAVNNVK